MSEQKKISVGAARWPVGIGGALPVPHGRAGVSQARHGLRRLRQADGKRCSRRRQRSAGWLAAFFQRSRGWSVEPSRGQCSYCS